MPVILTVCLSATIQKTVSFNQVQLEKVNRSQFYRLDASGKAVNSARVLNQINPESSMVLCPLGEKNAELFLELARKDNLFIEYVTIPGFTRECVTLLDRTAKTTTELVVGEPAINESCANQEKAFIKKYEKLLDFADGVLLAGSKPAVWSKTLYAKLAAIAVKHNKVFLADYIGSDMEETLKCCTPHIIKINGEEFEATFGIPATKENITQKSKDLKNIIVVTRGTDSTLAAQNGFFTECNTEKVENVVNTTACGDSFNAGFLYEYIQSGDFETALKEGTWCAARNAECDCPGSVRSCANETK